MKIENLSSSKFGALIEDFDCASFSQNDINQLRNALHHHQLLVFPQQSHLSPGHEVSFYKALYPVAKSIWRDQINNPWEVYKVEQGNQAGTYQIPHEPGVLVIGKGDINHHGLDVTLGGNRNAYGQDKGSQVLGGGALQWHIDGAFYDKEPCVYTQMHCIESPADAGFWLAYNDGSDHRIWCEAGATAFASGRTAYDLMSADDKALYQQSRVHYAANPFQQHFNLKNSANGLRIIDIDAEADFKQGKDSIIKPPADAKAKSYPLVWRCPISGKAALMPHPRCLIGLQPDPNSASTQMGIVLSRLTIEQLMRPAINPENVYVHQWQAGDLVIWHNHSVWHSATAGLSDQSRRIMHLTAFDGVEAPFNHTDNR